MGEVDVFVNNVGVFELAPFADISDDGAALRANGGALSTMPT